MASKFDLEKGLALLEEPPKGFELSILGIELFEIFGFKRLDVYVPPICLTPELLRPPLPPLGYKWVVLGL